MENQTTLHNPASNYFDSSQLLEELRRLAVGDLTVQLPTGQG